MGEFGRVWGIKNNALKVEMGLEHDSPLRQPKSRWAELLTSLSRRLMVEVLCVFS